MELYANMGKSRYSPLTVEMPDLGFVAVPGVNMSAHDIHELDCSPTQTPAQTRSNSPARGSNVSHSRREASEFISRLTSILESVEPSSTAGTIGCVKTGPEEDKSLLMHHHQTSAANGFEEQFSNIENHASISIVKATTVNPAQAKMDGLTKVNAIDGSGTISITAKIQILLIYFIFNLSLTLYNKAVMIMVSTRLSPQCVVWAPDTNSSSHSPSC